MKQRQSHSPLHQVCMSLLLLTHASFAVADCPQLGGHPIRWIVPNPPGGGHDLYSRLLQPFLEQRLKTRIVIENRAEAGGIVGAMAISRAAPDGRTLGFINASGLMTAALMPDSRAPDPRIDFTVLGRMNSNSMVMFSGRESGLNSIDDLLRLAQTRQIVVGVRDLGSTGFIAVPITASLLGVEYALVTGYVGNAARTLGVVRGEVDIVIHQFDSALPYLDAGELIPLLQLSDPQDRDSDDKLAGVPFLAGEGGVASRRAAASGRTPAQAEREAAALAEILGAGRLVVAPPGVADPLRSCLESVLEKVVNSEEFQAAAKRAQWETHFLDGKAATAAMQSGAEELAHFSTMVRAAVEQARQ